MAQLAQAAPFERALTGCVTAVFTAVASGVALRASSTPPLELRGPFADVDDGGVPRYLLRNVTCGVFGGDGYEVRVRVEAGARVRIETTSATKAYEARGGVARVATHLEVAAGGFLDFNAGTTILQHGANLEQRVEIVVQPGAQLRYSEVVALGRLAAGERLAFERFASTLLVKTPDGVVLYREAAELMPAAQPFLDETVGGAGVVGTLLACGGELRDVPAPTADGAVLAGSSALPRGGGLLVRAIGARAESVARYLRESGAIHVGPGWETGVAAPQ